MVDDPTGTLSGPESNGRTVGISLPLGLPLDPRASFLIAQERLALLASTARGPAVVAVAVGANGQVVDGLVLSDRQALILGRHTRCGMRLTEPSVSLRHVAALVRFEGARPVIHLRDLAGELPFRTEDGEPSGGVIADGPLYASIGGYALWFVPADVAVLHPRRAEEAWRALAPRAFVDRRPRIGVRALLSSPPRPEPAPDDTHTRITHVKAPLVLGEGDGPEIAWGTLRFAIGARRERRWVSAERLEHGVLLGRYARCSVLLDTPETTASRVHALLLRLGTEVWIVDTASTNGVRRGDARLVADVLRDADRITLGNEVTFEWERIQHPEA